MAKYDDCGSEQCRARVGYMIFGKRKVDRNQDMRPVFANIVNQQYQNWNHFNIASTNEIGI